MKRILLLAFGLVLFSLRMTQAQTVAALPSADQLMTGKGPLKIRAIMHASMVLEWDNKTIYVDPTGGAEKYKGLAAPDLILITDIHGDHLDPKTIAAINTKAGSTALPGGVVSAKGAVIIAPAAVAEILNKEVPKPAVFVMKNNESLTDGGLKIEAIPMYNLPETADSRHPKGRGNGYVLTFGDKRVYISGDTQGTPEMLSLKNIDAAFLCMNLPYTMDINEAAKAVLVFKPKIVYPFHSKGQDVGAFKQLVGKATGDIDVRILNWYPAN